MTQSLSTNLISHFLLPLDPLTLIGLHEIKPPKRRHLLLLRCSKNSISDFFNNPQSFNTSNKQNKPTLSKSYADFEEHHFIKMLNSSLNSGDYNSALHYLECFVSNGCKPRGKFCTKLIQGFFVVKRADKAVRVMEITEQKGVATVFSYTTLINGFCKMNNIEAAIKVLSRMRARGFPPTVLTYNIMIRSLCNVKKSGSALKGSIICLKINPTLMLGC